MTRLTTSFLAVAAICLFVQSKPTSSSPSETPLDVSDQQHKHCLGFIESDGRVPQSIKTDKAELCSKCEHVVRSHYEDWLFWTREKGISEFLQVGQHDECIKAVKHLWSICGTNKDRELFLCTRGAFDYPAPAIPDSKRAGLQELRESCKSRRFLIWQRSLPDFLFAGHGHSTWTFACNVHETIVLNRTLVYDDFAAMANTHTGAGDIEVPMAQWRDFWVLKSLPNSAISYHEFMHECGMQGVLDPKDSFVIPFDDPDRHLAGLKHKDTPVLKREFPEGSFGFHVCDKDHPWPHQVRDASWVDRTARAVLARLKENVDEAKGHMLVCVHVRRGDKATDTKQWPHVDHDTRPEAIVKRIQGRIPEGSVLFIATNEPNPDKFFAPMAPAYKVYTLDDFRDIIDTSKLLTSTVGLVDLKLNRLCPLLVETFREQPGKGFDPPLYLTDDPRHGINGPS